MRGSSRCARFDAAERGATIATRTSCVDAVRDGALWRLRLCPQAAVQRHPARPAPRHRRAPSSTPQVRGRAVPNEHAHAAKPVALRLVKGSHVVVRKRFAHDHAYIFQNADGRIIFAIPYEGDFTLIGTTDVEHGGAIGEGRRRPRRTTICASSEPLLSSRR